MSKRQELDDPIDHHPSTKRAKEIDAKPPYDELKDLLEAQTADIKTTNVLHWFRSQDLRTQDNKALHDAFETAKEASAPLICAYVNCEPELIWHGTSPARCDFVNETLTLMQKELKEKDIPLVFLEAAERDEIVPTITKFIKDHKISHVFANYEYEIDELRRDIKVLQNAKDNKYQVSLRHDQTIMEPGTMVTGAGKPMKVFTPYHQSWLGEIKDDPSLLDLVPAPSKQPGDKKGLKDLFDSKLPSLPKEKQFESNKERDRIRKLWPAGHDAGMKRMNEFIQKKIEKYASTRSNPAKDSSSRMSAYFSSGAVSMREAVSAVMKHNDGTSDFSQNGASAGVAAWVREIVFRELYRQTTLTTPHTAMNMPQNLKFDFVKWEDDEEGYKRWEEGTLGVPFVDAGMRQIKHEAYMHNRLRMNVSSYLYCNLLIDYRRGERYFAETLIDWDLSNNTQGWEPSYTVFNPISQAERNDPDGDYIRKWVPELKDVQGKAVFDPFHRLSKEEFKKLGYPEPYVDWSETKQRAMERFKSDMKDAEP
ncbi:Deoxyribodipyrimidine photo-lyase [Cyphellophora attinorum]|uniref:Deoxyribodipyrimidine photo-lyase n=1 Tax=Cyphellophora attinorum TaxID=1664694 RepID=A0A0N1NZP8_9EURO|nr:Deoxyribodipyrimidine photo-lyase [Phialophora attinorum]KPI41340.1 Deoxyribodipyrimidine photo-lyase [Phialophora attinorum]